MTLIYALLGIIGAGLGFCITQSYVHHRALIAQAAFNLTVSVSLDAVLPGTPILNPTERTRVMATLNAGVLRGAKAIYNAACERANGLGRNPVSWPFEECDASCYLCKRADLEREAKRYDEVEEEAEMSIITKCEGGCSWCDETQGEHYSCNQEIDRLTALVAAKDKVLDEIISERDLARRELKWLRYQIRSLFRDYKQLCDNQEGK